MTKFSYIDTKQMKPREGVKFATVYYVQTPQERERMSKWLTEQIKTIMNVLQTDPYVMDAAHEPMKAFPKTRGQKSRSLIELLEDMAGEIQGTKKDGTPKDFAKAPIERWNKMFQNSPYQFSLLEQGESQAKQFGRLFK